MKNMISYYYDLNVEKIVYHEKKYYFNIGSTVYIFKELLTEVPFYEFVVQQLNRYEYFFKIKKNINNNYITIINNKKYVLLLNKNRYLNYKLCLNDLKTEYYLTVDNSYYNKFHWVTLWENKIDAFEKMLNSKKEKIYGMLPIYNYYIGVGETAILYLKKTILNHEYNIRNFVASHRRISNNMTLYDYYDPTNIILDHPSRDIAEYVKSAIINNCFDINEFEGYLNKIKFQKTELQLLFSRIMFPTFFFDYLEKNINMNKNEQKKIIENYELNLDNINDLLVRKYDIEIVEWIKKNRAKYRKST